MAFGDLIPWSRKSPSISRGGDHPLVALHREMDRLFDSFVSQMGRPFQSAGDGFPHADVVDADKEIEVTVELPGVDEKGIEVSVSEDTLTIKGEKRSEREEKDKGYYLSERSFGAFQRSIPLPHGINADEARAEFKQGVLKITLPKTPEAQSNVKRIDVKAT